MGHSVVAVDVISGSQQQHIRRRADREESTYEYLRWTSSSVCANISATYIYASSMRYQNVLSRAPHGSALSLIAMYEVCITEFSYKDVCMTHGKKVGVQPFSFFRQVSRLRRSTATTVHLTQNK